MSDIISKLDELIAVMSAAVIPLDARWLSAKQVGAMLGYSEYQVCERLACRPDFPKALRLNGHGHPRWKASEVQRWAEDERAKYNRAA